MAANDDFFQRRKPAAVLKHALLAEYFTVFTTMLGSQSKGRPVWLIDGYAGPGRYEADENGVAVEGSPLIALKVARKAANYAVPRHVRCAFIEQNPKYASQLEANVAPFRKQGLHADTRCGTVQDQLPDLWAQVGQSPALTLLDPFGVSMRRDLMLSTLLSRAQPPSEVLVNVNVEAIRRHGGCLWRTTAGGVEVKPGLDPSGVEKADGFLGGQRWRGTFLDTRERTGSAAEAARVVVAEYQRQVCMDAGVQSISVPIRRRPEHEPLFIFTLFHRSETAAYMFADAAARATRKWREAYRAKDLAEWIAKSRVSHGELDLFGDDGTDIVQQINATDADRAERELDRQLVDVVAANIRALLATRPVVPVAASISSILGTALSIAGEPVIRKAWDLLAAEGVAAKRLPDKTQKLRKQSIVKP